MWHDLKTALRSLRRNPSFTFIAAGTLALGIGANVAMFSVVRYVLLDSLPVDDPGELVLAYWSGPGGLRINNIASSGRADPATGAQLHSNYSYPLYRDLQRVVEESGASAAGFNFIRQLSVRIDDQPALLAGGLLADGRYFPTLRLGMTLGRPLDVDDDRRDAPAVTVISHAFWQRALGSDPDAVGRTIRLNGVPFEIVGVTAPAFRGISRGGFFPQTEVTVPLTAQPIVAPRWSRDGTSLASDETTFWVRLLLRVPGSLSGETVATAMETVLVPRLPAEARGGTPAPAIRMHSGARGEESVPAEGQRLLLLLSGVVGIVLVIACLNLASLMLARGMTRQREIAVRRALGASRPRLIRQVLFESLALALAGAAGGLLITLTGRAVLARILNAGFGSAAASTVSLNLAVDGTLLAMTVGVATMAAVAFGLWPAVRLARVDPARQLMHRVTGRGMPGLTLGRMLIAAQIGISLPLVVGAILLVNTIRNLDRVTLGFDPRGVAVFNLNPEYAGVAESEYAALYRDVLREVSAVPGVAKATLIENVLMSGVGSSNRVTVGTGEHVVSINAIGPDFFETMGMRLIAGRAPTAADDASTPSIAVVNETAIATVFGGASPVGQLVRMGSQSIEIVGVVADSRYRQPQETIRPTLFPAAFQRAGFGGHHVVVKTAAPVATLAPAIREAVARVDGNLPVPTLRTQEELVAGAVAREHVLAELLSVFGAFALVLTCIGLHGVTSYSVTRRTNEIGVRVALGARAGQVVWLVLRQVLTVAAAGLGVGLPLTLAAGTVLDATLYGVAPRDPLMIALAAAALIAVTLAAGALPARRAAAYHPVEALRAD